MGIIHKPLIVSLNDNIDDLNAFEKDLNSRDDDNTNLMLRSPVVYIHKWKQPDRDKIQVYVGETNNIIKRTNEHYESGRKDGTWQKDMVRNKGDLLVIGHEHFNKSLTLDVENRLIEYMLACPGHIDNRNSRGNPQGSYYPDDEFDAIFGKIWLGLGLNDSEVFVKESEIKKSAIYKASPLHKLFPDQMEAKTKILQTVNSALTRGEKQLIFVEGEAGTGKTVLMSSTFYELCRNSLDRGEDLKCCLVVNHNEQLTVYQQIVKRLGFEDSNVTVYKPASFIKRIEKENPVDIVFIDEAHLLLTQGNQAYSGENQLKDIMERAQITVIMYDEWQNLNTEQYWNPEDIDALRQKAKAKNNYIELKAQLRIDASDKVIAWINSITKDGILNAIPYDDSKYEIKVFKSPKQLEDAIIEKAQKPDSSLSRLVATYDWEYNGAHSAREKYPDGDKEYWEVNIDGWHRPWNYELGTGRTRSEKLKNKDLAWAEQEHTIGEVGSTYTIQGFDLNYVGVILGPSIKYRNGRIVFDPSASKNKHATQKRTLADKTKKSFGEMFLQHEFKVLMTRGVNGLYIYACDEELREALLSEQPLGIYPENEIAHVNLFDKENKFVFGETESGYMLAAEEKSVFGEDKYPESQEESMFLAAEETEKFGE